MILEGIIRGLERLKRKYIYSQVRIGKNEVPFTMYKIRTMEKSSDSDQHERFLKKPIRYEERLLWYGPILRFIGIDELAQLYNIAKGEMALVGPRPLPEYELKYFPREVREKRQLVKPGSFPSCYATFKELTPELAYELDLAFVDMAKENYTRAQIYFGMKGFYSLLYEWMGCLIFGKRRLRRY